MRRSREPCYGCCNLHPNHPVEDDDDDDDDDDGDDGDDAKAGRTKSIPLQTKCIVMSRLLFSFTHATSLHLLLNNMKTTMKTTNNEHGGSQLNK